jgi:hypothetical protein
MSAAIVTVSVIVCAGVFGAANAAQNMALWELVRRGVATGRRGALMGWTFGLGPVLACIGSLLQQVLLSSEPLTGFSFAVPFPDNYAWLFAAALPALAASIFLGFAFVIPPPAGETIPAASMADVLGGVREFVTTRALLTCALAYVLTYAGGRAILDNVSLHARHVLGPDAQDTVGLQNFLRFGFKAAAGVLLGQLLARTNARAPLLATIGLLLVGMGWALNATGWWYLLTVGWLGAGELFGAYFFNYVTTASRPAHVRVNIAYLNLLGIVVGFASVTYGHVSESHGRLATFYLASGILVVAVLLVLFSVPARPGSKAEPASMNADKKGS